MRIASTKWTKLMKIIFLKIFLIFTILLRCQSQELPTGGHGNHLDDFPLDFVAQSTSITFNIVNNNITLLDVSCKAVSSGEEEIRTAGGLICENLKPCTIYEVTVRLFSNNTDETFRRTTFIQTSYAEPQTAITLTIPLTDAIFLNWKTNSSSCISEYIISALSLTNFSDEKILNGKNTDAFFENLEPCTLYQIRLIAKDIYENITHNESISIETSFEDPGPVKSLNISEHYNNSVIIAWDAPRYESCVQYYYFKWAKCIADEEEACKWHHFNSSGIETKTFTIQNVEGCEAHKLHVRMNGDQSNSTIYNFRHSKSVPGPVLELKILNKTSTNFTATWLKPEVNPSCVVEYMTTIRGREYFTNETEFEFLNLEPCGEYSVRVRAVAANENFGPWSEKDVTMSYDKPSKPRQFKANLYPTQMEIEWKPPEFASLCVDKYVVTYWRFDDIGMQIGNNNSVETNTTKLTLNNLIACTPYTIQFVAITFNDGEHNSNPAQVVYETIPAPVQMPDSLEGLDITSTSIELRAVSADQTNACQKLYARFYCETIHEPQFKRIETMVEVRSSATVFKGIVGPLTPVTDYKCGVEIFNIADWSTAQTALFTTLPDYPEKPFEVEATPTSSTTIVFKWKRPKRTNGKLLLYRIYIQTIEPKYYIPKFCQPLKWVEKTELIEQSKTEYIFYEGLPYVEYSFQVAAINDFGVSFFTTPLTASTLPTVPGPVSNISLASIDGPDLSEIYRATAHIKFFLPCRAHGIITGFRGSFYGTRQLRDSENFEWTFAINDTSLIETDFLQISEDRLRPEYNYKVTIQVFIDGITEPSEEVSFNFTSPAGIPLSEDLPEESEVNPFETQNPTNSALVRFSTKLMESKMGHVMYVALLLSEQECQEDPVPQFNLIDSQHDWPKIANWQNATKDKCIIQYQTTPIRWRPQFSNSRLSANHAVIVYTIGSDEDCENGNIFCNGHLRPDTKYTLMIRLFTRSGYSDISVKGFKTDSEIEMTFILLLSVSCLFLAFLLGLIYLWATKKIIWREPFNGVDGQTIDISSKNFLVHFAEISKKEKIEREYKELVAITNEALSNVASRANESKNRYSNIYPYDKNRVILDNDGEGTDYINASFINGYKQKKEYIATQGPKPESFIDFWRMVIQHNIYIIVMLTQMQEGDITKCHKYFPMLNEEMEIGQHIKITCAKENYFDSFDRKEFQINHTTSSTKRTIIHYHFKKWPDHGCPTNPVDLIEIVKVVKTEKIPSHSPIVVHCSAGVGRTGTFIALDIIMQRLKVESKINIFEIVKELRFQRMKMVQNFDQYQFLYSCAYQLVSQKRLSKTGSKPCLNRRVQEQSNGHVDRIPRRSYSSNNFETPM